MKIRFNNLRYSLPFHFITIITSWLPDNIPFLRLRGWLLSFFVKSAGKNLQIGRDVTIYNPSLLSFGDNVYVAKGCFFSCKERIDIGSNILFAPYVVIVTSDHSFENGSYYWGNPKNIGKVTIKDGSWIAAHSTVLSNTIINKGVLVAANSVIRGNTEEFGIYAGTPAKLIKQINANS